VKPYGPDSPWRLDPVVTYVNHGSFGACPVPVLEAQRAMIDELEAEPIRFLWATFEERLDAARREVAAFLHADPEGLVFVPNATTGVSTVLRSLRFEPGDELLTTNHEYNARSSTPRPRSPGSPAHVSSSRSSPSRSRAMPRRSRRSSRRSRRGHGSP